MSGDNKHIQMSSVRREDQRQVMEEIRKEGHCPFCRENLNKYHKSPILKEGKYWLLTDNQWPYEKVKHQLLAIYHEHIEHIKDMAPEAGKELIEMFADVARERNIAGGGIAIRFGKNPELGNYGSSVFHLHAHMIEPDLAALGETEAWKFKFGEPKNYKKEHRAFKPGA
jgi:diadenosine tetraphosphate (Ap4A) HIT family hydrolase